MARLFHLGAIAFVAAESLGWHSFVPLTLLGGRLCVAGSLRKGFIERWVDSQSCFINDLPTWVFTVAYTIFLQCSSAAATPGFFWCLRSGGAGAGPNAWLELTEQGGKWTLAAQHPRILLIRPVQAGHGPAQQRRPHLPPFIIGEVFEGSELRPRHRSRSAISVAIQQPIGRRGRAKREPPGRDDADQIEADRRPTARPAAAASGLAAHVAQQADGLGASHNCSP